MWRSSARFHGRSPCLRGWEWNRRLHERPPVVPTPFPAEHVEGLCTAATLTHPAAARSRRRTVGRRPGRRPAPRPARPGSHRPHSERGAPRSGGARERTPRSRPDRDASAGSSRCSSRRACKRITPTKHRGGPKCDTSTIAARRPGTAPTRFATPASRQTTSFQVARRIPPPTTSARRRAGGERNATIWIVRPAAQPRDRLRPIRAPARALCQLADAGSGCIGSAPFRHRSREPRYPREARSRGGSRTSALPSRRLPAARSDWRPTATS